MIWTAHLFIAKRLEMEEIALSPEEAKKLAEAAQQVQELYDVVVDPKVLAWGNLAMVAVSIYGPRLMVMSHKGRFSRKPKVVDNA